MLNIIRGTWVRYWQRRLGWYCAANGVTPAPAFNAESDTWDRASEVTAVRVKKHAGIAPADGRLDGNLRDVLRKASAPAPTPVTIIDVRSADAKTKYGFAVHPTKVFPRRYGPVRGVTCHYTASLATPQQDATFHVTGRGWPGLTYHIIVGVDGVVWVVNDANQVTWHALGLNYHTIGLSFVGNAAGPNQAQQLALRYVLDKLADGSFGYGYPTVRTVTSHRHTALIDPSYATDCPGDAGEAFYQRAAAGRFTTDAPSLVV